MSESRTSAIVASAPALVASLWAPWSPDWTKPTAPLAPGADPTPSFPPF